MILVETKIYQPFLRRPDQLKKKFRDSLVKLLLPGELFCSKHEMWALLLILKM